MLNNTGVEIFEGRGRVKDAHTVEVGLADLSGLKTLSTRYIVLATGSRANRLPIPGVEHCITSDEALALEQQPKRVAVIGAGYIAVEFAGIFAGVGSEVHLCYRADLPLRGFDQECRQEVADNLVKRGINCHVGYTPSSVDKNEDGSYTFTMDSPGKPSVSIIVDEVMMATGRAPLSGNLGLEGVLVLSAMAALLAAVHHSRNTSPQSRSARI